MIQEISLTNFKCLEDVCIKPRLITVLIGPNGSGKSSVLQALALLKQSRQHVSLNFAGPLVDLGTYEDVVFTRKPSLDIAFGLRGSLAVPLALLEAFQGTSPQVEFAHNLVLDPRGLRSVAIWIKTGRFELNGGWLRGAPHGQLTPRFYEERGLRYTFSLREATAQPIHYEATGVSDENRDFFDKCSRAFDSVLSVVRQVLERTFVVPAIRAFHKPQARFAPTQASDFISPEGSMKQAEDLASAIAYDPLIAKNISQWLERVTGGGIEHHARPGPAVALETSMQDFKVNLVNEGAGLSQLVFCFGQLAAAPADSFVAIEEPEIHLHPRAQASLADVFVEIAKEENKQILLTTHSEHILFSLLTSIAEGKLGTDELAVYYFEKQNAASTARGLRVDEQGKIEGGLPGFFEANIKQFRRYLDALAQGKDS